MRLCQRGTLTFLPPPPLLSLKPNCSCSEKWVYPSGFSFSFSLFPLSFYLSLSNYFQKVHWKSHFSDLMPCLSIFPTFLFFFTNFCSLSLFLFIFLSLNHACCSLCLSREAWSGTILLALACLPARTSLSLIIYPNLEAETKTKKENNEKNASACVSVMCIDNNINNNKQVVCVNRCFVDVIFKISNYLKSEFLKMAKTICTPLYVNRF